MSDTMNWIERRARKEQNLSQSVEIWESVRTAIHNCCTSFNKHYEKLAQLNKITENGHRVRVTIIFSHLPKQPINVSFEFSERDNGITTTVDGAAARRFKIAADENHAFLQHGQEEISADKLTELVLEGPMFNAAQE